MRSKSPWWALLFVFVASFAVLLFTGKRIAEEAPPIPTRVVTASGEVLVATDEVRLSLVRPASKAASAPALQIGRAHV